MCDQSSDNAQCPCIPNVESITCRVPTADHFSKALDDIVFDAELATLVGVGHIATHYNKYCYYHDASSYIGISSAHSISWKYRTIYWSRVCLTGVI